MTRVLTPFPSRPNEIGHSIMAAALDPPLAPPSPPNDYEGLPDGLGKDAKDLWGSKGPFWWRELSKEDDERKVCNKWAKQLESSLGVRRVIGGEFSWGR